MTGTTRALRAAITGLIWLAAAEEEELLASAPYGEQGNPQCWTALPLAAHNTRFRRQQAARLEAVRRNDTPPGFPGSGHRSPDTYRRYSAAGTARTISAVGQSAGDLIGRLGSVSEAGLTGASHPWLRGRHLWQRHASCACVSS